MSRGDSVDIHKKACNIHCVSELWTCHSSAARLVQHFALRWHPLVAHLKRLQLPPSVDRLEGSGIASACRWKRGHWHAWSYRCKRWWGMYVPALIFVWKLIANKRIVSWFQGDNFKELFQSIATLSIAGGKPRSRMNAATWAEEACAGICCLEDRVIITPFSTKYLLHANYIMINGGQCYGFST